MKRKWHHPQETAPAESGRRYWRSVDELEDSAEFRGWLEKEFPRGASELEGAEDPESRRTFLKIMGASASLAGLGLSGCRRPESLLVPFNEHVEWSIPGKNLFYSTAIPEPDGCTPLVVATQEGRPLKVDGNKLHPECGGGTSAFVQSSILELYDPERSKSVLKEGELSDGDAFEAEFLASFRESAGKKGALLLGYSTSPTRARLLEEAAKAMPDLKVYEYEPLVSEIRRQAEEMLWGKGVSAVPQFDKATRILSLDADFLGLDPQGEDAGRQWAAGRDPEADMNRLYVVEPSFTITGGSSDHRMRLPSSQVLKITALFAEAIAKQNGNSLLSGAIAPIVNGDHFSREVFDTEWIEEAAIDLVKAGGKSLIVVGSHQPLIVHTLAGLINQALGSAGGKDSPLALCKSGRKLLPGIADLTKAINAGDVETVISLTPADPAFDAPADLMFTEAWGKLKHTVHCGMRINQTAMASEWHVPAAHYLESWGDVYSAKGVYSVVQPMILPLYGGKSDIDFLLTLMNAPEAPAEGEAAPAMPTPDAEAPTYKAVRETFATMARGDVDTTWNFTVRNGFLEGSAFDLVDAGGGSPADGVREINITDVPFPGSFEVVLRPSSHLWDGRYVNNSWLQEVPDPITKLTWDNAALVSFATAETLDVRDGEMITLTVGEGESATELTVPVIRIPGHADHTISLELGYYGEDLEVVGNVANLSKGFNTYPLRTSTNPLFISGVSAVKTGTTYKLAQTSHHWSMENRAIVREATHERYETEDYTAALEGMDSHIPENISLYKGPDYMNATQHEGPFQGKVQLDPNHQWAMTVDLNSCIGCNACTISCQAENNIPVVGKDQVYDGREMHWIRMDRYFSSPETTEDPNPNDPIMGGKRGRPVMDDDQVQMLTQPVACVHCESAPCETVCPVNATVHTADGLNAMVYNRCIGTRYCANNCPYKARRFNYFDYNKRPIDKFYHGPLAPADGLGRTSLQLQKNPNVTVRMRGVIEKCTYCVQRLQGAMIDAKAEARDSAEYQVPANSVTTACQDACPTGAIEFGNLKNEEDSVNKLKLNKRNYDLLKYIGTRPRTSYLAKVRNPNPSMPDAAHVGTATVNMH